MNIRSFQGIYTRSSRLLRVLRGVLVFPKQGHRSRTAIQKNSRGYSQNESSRELYDFINLRLSHFPAQ